MISQDSQASQLLSRAVLKQDYSQVAAALQDGEDPNICVTFDIGKENGGKLKIPLLTVAVHKGNVDIITLFINAQANLELRGQYRDTPLLHAIWHKKTFIIYKLLSAGADARATDTTYGDSSMHLAAAKGNIYLLQHLKSLGCPLDNHNYKGDTPLHTAAFRGRQDIAEWLVGKGAEVQPVNNKGLTPADVAKYRKNLNLATWLNDNNNSSSTQQSIQTITEENSKGKVYVLNYQEFPDTVIANSQEKKLKMREGAQIDSENLKNTFTNLGYEVEVHHNKSSSETEDILENIQKDKSLNFLFLFIMTHGLNSQTFFASDGQLIDLTNIKQRFTDTACPQLKGKPKIFFVHFCRGNNKEILELDSSVPKSEAPHNMITVYASHEGFTALRSPESGTVFVSSLCDVLSEYPCEMLQDTFNRLYAKMKTNGGTTPEMTVSAPFAHFKF